MRHATLRCVLPLLFLCLLPHLTARPRAGRNRAGCLTSPRGRSTGHRAPHSRRRPARRGALPDRPNHRRPAAPLPRQPHPPPLRLDPISADLPVRRQVLRPDRRFEDEPEHPRAPVDVHVFMCGSGYAARPRHSRWGTSSTGPSCSRRRPGGRRSATGSPPSEDGQHARRGALRSQPMADRCVGWHGGGLGRLIGGAASRPARDAAADAQCRMKGGVVRRGVGPQ